MKHRPKLSHTRTMELHALLVAMNKAKSTFYGLAVTIGMHEFIEFAGIMKTYIDMCEDALESGVDFQCDFDRAIMKDHQLAYIAEKLECIFGDQFKVGRAL